MTFYKNKITLLKIQKLISSIEEQNKFINKLFDPLKKPKKLTFLDSYMGKNKTYFMNGNYMKNRNDVIIRVNTRMLKNFTEQLQDDVIFKKMLASVENIFDVGILNAEHKVFGLIEKDMEAMPEKFIKSINNCIDSKKFYEALLFLIIWSIYGECIKELAPVYEKFYMINIDTGKYDENKNDTIRLVSNTKPCRDVFKGRDELLLQIHEHFQNKRHFLFLQGTGDIGKSELAKQYADKYSSSYDVIVFAECDESLVSAVNDNNKFLFEPIISKSDNETEQQLYERKLSALRRQTDRILVILDNMDYLSEEIDSFLSVPFDVIITTRYNYSEHYSDKTRIIGAIENRQTLRKIFSEYYGKNISSDHFTDMLIDMFESHTMAIELIAKQMKKSKLTPEKMYNILEKSEETELHETFVVRNYSPTQKNISGYMQKLFNIASLNENEQYIMKCLSLLPISGMNKSDFKKCCNFVDYSVINGLVERSWIREIDDCISIHALIQETVKIVLKPDLLDCIKFLNGMIREFSESWCYYANREEKDKISQIIIHIYNNFPEPTPELYDFFEWTLVILTHCSNHFAFEIIKKLAVVYEKEFDENHFRTANIYGMVGYVNKNCSFIDESVYCFKKCVNIIENLENKSAEQMIYLSNIYVTLTNIYTEYYDLQNNKILLNETIMLCNKIIEIRTNFKGRIDNSFNLSLVAPYRNLAWTAICCRNYNEAYKYIEKSSSEYKKSDSEFELFLINLTKSRISQEHGDLQSSIDYMCSAIKQYEKHFGSNRVIKTIQMYIELGDLYIKTGNPDYISYASECYRKAIEYMHGSNSCMKFYNEVIEKLQSISE